MFYLEKLICENKNIFEKYNINIFFMVGQIEEPHYNEAGVLENPQTLGTDKNKNVYLLPHNYALIRSWPAARMVLMGAMPNVKLRFFAVNAKMLKINAQNIPVFENPIELLEPVSYSNSIDAVDAYAEHNTINSFNLRHHWKISVSQRSIPVSKSTIIYLGPFEGETEVRLKTHHFFSSAQAGGAKVIDNPDYATTKFLSEHGFKDSKDLIRQYMPDYYPEHCEGDKFFKALAFFEKHKHIVVKPPHLVGGSQIYFFDARHIDPQSEEYEELVSQFEETFFKIKAMAGGRRVLVQKFIEGILENGETRVYLIGDAILPIGINMYDQDADKPFKPEFNAKSRAVLLDEETLKIANIFREKAQKLGLFYYGLDIIRQKNPDGTSRHYVLEANYGTVGFYPRIVRYMDLHFPEIKAHIETLSEDLREHIELYPMNRLVYMPLFYKIEQLRLLRLLDQADKETLALQIDMMSETANMPSPQAELPPKKTAKVTAYPSKKFFAANIQKNSAGKKRKKGK